MENKERIQGLRIDQPDICWRPNPSWENVCILNLGHTGCCGWEDMSSRIRDKWSEPITRRRLLSCVKQWPECEEGQYNPNCCRFPKSCSCTCWDPEYTSEADLESI